MGGTVRCRWATALRAAAFGASLLGGLSAAYAGSDNSSDTWAGDVNGLALPPGTFIAIDYSGYRHSDTYVTGAPNDIIRTLSGKHELASTGEVWTDIARLVYFTSLFDRPLVLEAAVPFVKFDEVNIGNFPAPIGGLGPQTTHGGADHPVLFFTYGLVVQPQMERFLGVTNYFFVPMEFGTFCKFCQVNSSNPGQFTWVPQVEYAEGLGKYIPGLKNLWIDVIANASIHTDGGSPFALAPGVQFDRLTQENSYDIKAFLTYHYAPGGLFAVGLEKSWGGNQTASGGVLQAIFGGPQSLGKDDFLKGHVQFVYPIRPDLHIGADITHDFDRSGGLKEDITAEVRVTKFWVPAQEPLK